jgi:anti-sigma regulatory factor (Ser/Thr protein kinase)
VSDEIRLTIPAEEDFQRIAHLVVGGLAVRLDVTFENLEDLHLALEGLLERCNDDGDVTIAVRVGDDELQASVGPFPAGKLQAELAHDPGNGLGLRRVLETVTDEFRVDERDGAEWAELRKRLHRMGADA